MLGSVYFTNPPPLLSHARSPPLLSPTPSSPIPLSLIPTMQSLKKMVERIRVYKALNDQIFSVLNKHISTSETFQRPVMEFQPPIYQA